MNVLLVGNILLELDKGINKTVLQPHLGLISLLAAIESAGHSAELYDPMLSLYRGELSLDGSLYSAIATRILDRQPDVVGLTSLGCNFISTLK
jgi:hypothetical protein